MFGLSKLLFGEKTKINNPDLGFFEARIKNSNQKDIIWTGAIKSKEYNNELIILLIGNSNGPYKSQIETIKTILNDLENIYKQIVGIINDDSILQDKFQNKKISDFYLACINPWKKGEISYELTFDLKNGDGYVGAIFKNGNI